MKGSLRLFDNRLDGPLKMKIVVRSCAVCILASMALSHFGVAALAQKRNDENVPSPTSDLANDNLDRVVALESQIAEVLRNNPCLLVEPKRWVANSEFEDGPGSLSWSGKERS
jgi:hypothetical protein